MPSFYFAKVLESLTPHFFRRLWTPRPVQATFSGQMSPNNDLLTCSSPSDFSVFAVLSDNSNPSDNCHRRYYRFSTKSSAARMTPDGQATSYRSPTTYKSMAPLWSKRCNTRLELDLSLEQNGFPGSRKTQ